MSFISFKILLWLTIIFHLHLLVLRMDETPWLITLVEHWCIGLKVSKPLISVLSVSCISKVVSINVEGAIVS